ncbi:hypothetical protein D4R99_02355 [bacterium]|nr:MAG: hypothetical protein D4R99_02355 [bacterium]
MISTTINTSFLPPFPIDLSPLSASAISFVKDPSSLWHDFLSSNFFLMFHFFLIFISAAFFIGIVLMVAKIQNVHKKDKKESVARNIRFEKTKSTRWGIVEKHMESDNPAEWKLAVIEADSMLEAMVKKMGYDGATLGEMLKRIEISDFTTLNDAWQAHKVRNFIAHQGSSYLLSKHQAREVIKLYEKVFKEFELI